MTKLNYFTTAEFLAHDSEKEKQDYQKSPQMQGYLEELRARLNIARRKLGLPIIITSWYRDQEHNERTPGHSSTSQHLDGSAVDCKCSNNSKLLDVFKAMIDEGIDFGQIIVYGRSNIRFIHISLPTRSSYNQIIFKT